MKYCLTLLLALSLGTITGQVCPVIEKRNNGNGNASKCAGAGTTPMAPNFIGTPFATNFLGLDKEGDITMIFEGNVQNPPAIKRIWIENEISISVAGPATVPELTSDGNTRVKYCFYVQNLPPSGSYTLEFVDPETEEVISLCGFDGTTSAPVDPPIILSQSQNQNLCLDDSLYLQVTAQSVYGGSLQYQWSKNGVDIISETDSILTISSVLENDSGIYQCLIGEINGSYTFSSPISVTVTICPDNNFFNSCEPSTISTTLTSSWNSAWVDINNDGYEDLFVTDKNASLNNIIYLNNSQGGFSKISNGNSINSNSKAITSAWADFDNDNDLDVFIVNATQKKSSLHLNDGNGQFIELTNSGIDKTAQYFHGAVWADFNNDGYVDLFITNYFETRFHHLYRNNGDNTFSKINSSQITLESNRSMAPILSDFDEDGLVDIFIPNGDGDPNSLFRNIGNFEFQKITTGPFASDQYNSVGAAWGDYNNDGHMDLFVANASGQNNNLYRNNGDGSFQSITGSIVTNDGGHSHGAYWGDFDNDGNIDLFVTNDAGPNYLYINDGNGNFIKDTEESITLQTGKNYGHSWSDYNRDGFLDSYISYDGYASDKLFCNIGNENSWLNVRLTGTSSNKSAMGSRISIKSGGNWQTREILPVSGFGSNNSIRAHFGLGNATAIDSILIKWPSGNIQHVTSGININTFITITEEESNILNGVTFNDKNQNGIKDENEETIGGIKINISPSNHSLSSNTIGGFHIRLADGDYTLSFPDLIHWTSPGNTSFQLSPSNDSIYLEIPLYADETGHDLKVDFATTAWRRGFTNNTIVQAINLGTEKVYNVSVILDYPEDGTIVSSEKDYTEIAANSFEWIIDSMSPGESIGFFAIDSIFLSASTGQMLSLTANISADGIELDPSNNTNTQEIEVVGAIDPNDILVSPKGERTEGYISKEQWLTYTIRFQNVGTYYATMVNIENQIPEYLDLNSFEVVSSSHSYNYNINEKGVLSIQYLGINLPDSTTNEEESHGYFKYTMRPQEELMGQERIVNQASIVFDFEEAIVTNTVLNTIKYNKNDVYKLIVYPNPANDETNIAIDMEYFKFNYSPMIVSFSVISIESGQSYLSKEVSTNEVKIALENIPSGYYLIYAIDEEGNIHTGKLIIP